MQSPYQNSGQGQYYGTPDGLGYLLARRNAENAAALENIGQFAGAVGAGIGGAVQAQNNPELMAQAFGAGKGSPAQAGLMNFAAAYGGGQSGFSGLKTSDNPAAGGMNFKQLAELGKAADGFRNALVAGQPTVGDDEPNVFGKDEEWKTLGAREKFGRVQGFIQQNAEKAALQKMAAIGQEMRMREQQMNADKAFGRDLAAANQAAPEMIAAPGAPHQGQSLLTRFMTKASPEALQSTRNVGNLIDMDRIGADGAGFRFDPKTMVTDLGQGDRFVQTSRGGGQITRSPENLIEQKPDYEPAPGMMFIRRGKYWSEVEDPTQWETITEGGIGGEPRYTRKRYVGKGAASQPTEPPGNTDATELKLAQDALAAGADRKKVAAKYKQRTGKELPQ